MYSTYPKSEYQVTTNIYINNLSIHREIHRIVILQNFTVRIITLTIYSIF